MQPVEKIDQYPGKGIVVVLHIIGLSVIYNPVVKGKEEMEMDDVHNDDIMPQIMTEGVIEEPGSPRTWNCLDFQCR
jgi:hypothetical protein